MGRLSNVQGARRKDITQEAVREFRNPFGCSLLKSFGCMLVESVGCMFRSPFGSFLKSFGYM